MRILSILGFTFAIHAQESLTQRERLLLKRIENLEQRIAILESRSSPPPAPSSALLPVPEAPASSSPPATTLSVNLDGYYGYNFNRPYSAINPLRPYDVSSNGFSISQAGLILEHLPNAASGRRIGGRLDLMFGQATETLQGSTANELRPFVFRHLFQAYGTYVAPVGRGLTVDFGKWASSLGSEGNYAKDQLNYSRSYWFSFLPFYHTGVRVTYPVTPDVKAAYWLTNGGNQTEDFNSFKSQAVALSFSQEGKLSANLNYFSSQEQIAVNGRAPRGRTHYLNSYFTWIPSENWTLAGEANYAVSRVDPISPAQVVFGGAAYARYRFHPRFHLASRLTYLSDQAGWFSGTSQALKDGTLTATFGVFDGFQMRWEYRRDWSNTAFFPASDPRRLKQQQDTAVLGLIWWLGDK
jgi:hypothetical protein